MGPRKDTGSAEAGQRSEARRSPGPGGASLSVVWHGRGPAGAAQKRDACRHGVSVRSLAGVPTLPLSARPAEKTQTFGYRQKDLFRRLLCERPPPACPGWTCVSRADLPVDPTTPISFCPGAPSWPPCPTPCLSRRLAFSGLSYRRVAVKKKPA